MLRHDTRLLHNTGLDAIGSLYGIDAFRLLAVSQNLHSTNARYQSFSENINKTKEVSKYSSAFNASNSCSTSSSHLTTGAWPTCKSSKNNPPLTVNKTSSITHWLNPNNPLNGFQPKPRSIITRLKLQWFLIRILRSHYINRSAPHLQRNLIVINGLELTKIPQPMKRSPLKNPPLNTSRAKLNRLLHIKQCPLILRLRREHGRAFRVEMWLSGSIWMALVNLSLSFLIRNRESWLFRDKDEVRRLTLRWSSLWPDKLWCLRSLVGRLLSRIGDSGL